MQDSNYTVLFSVNPAYFLMNKQFTPESRCYMIAPQFYFEGKVLSLPFKNSFI